MGRRNQPSYIVPTKSDGSLAVESAGDSAFGVNRGVVTLEVATYYAAIPCGDGMVASLHTQGDAAIAITSVTIEETNLGESEVALHSDNIGEWVAVDAARIVSGVEGTGWTNTNDVIANGAGNAGGGVQTIVDAGTRRMRAKIVVGTGGQARFAAWSKE